MRKSKAIIQWTLINNKPIIAIINNNNNNNDFDKCDHAINMTFWV